MSESTETNKFLPPQPDYRPNPRSLTFWRDSFLYVWFYSLIGHFIEYPWIFLMRAFGQDLSYPPLLVLAAPYGLGVLGIMWFVYPVVKNKKIGPLSTYIYGVLICTAVEFFSALLIFLALGHNPFWNYSTDVISLFGQTIPLNFFGFVCLKNSLAFGLVALLFVYFLFPISEHIMKKLGPKKLNVVFWILFTCYVLVHLGVLATTGSLIG